MKPGARARCSQQGYPRRPFGANFACLPRRSGFSPARSQSDTLVPLAGQTGSDPSPSLRGLGGAGACGSRVASEYWKDAGGSCKSQRAVLEFVHWDALHSRFGEKGARSSPEPVPEPPPPPADKSWGERVEGGNRVRVLILRNWERTAPARRLLATPDL